MEESRGGEGGTGGVGRLIFPEKSPKTKSEKYNRGFNEEFSFVFKTQC